MEPTTRETLTAALDQARDALEVALLEIDWLIREGEDEKAMRQRIDQAYDMVDGLFNDALRKLA